MIFKLLRVNPLRLTNQNLHVYATFRPVLNASRTVVWCRTISSLYYTKKPSLLIQRVQYNFVQSVRNMADHEENRNLDYNDIMLLKQKGNSVFVDVRNPDEVAETGVLPGSIHIPLPELESALKLSEEEFQKKFNNPKPGKETELVFSCRSGNRSEKAMRAALSMGFNNAKHYKGGYLDWEKNTSQKN